MLTKEVLYGNIFLVAESFSFGGLCWRFRDAHEVEPREELTSEGQ
jgi:hypothetical protein